MMNSLPRNLQSRPFKWSEAKKEGLTQYSIQKLLDTKVIERISHGVYVFKDQIDISEVDQFKIHLLCLGQPSAICLISALVYFHLTDVIPKKTWILVNASKTTHQKGIRLWRRRNPQWNVGITNLDEIKITSIARTLVDCLRFHNLVGGPQFILKAVRLALEEKKINMSDLLKMAEKLGVKKRILPYLEALS